jgi:hypothetical protein
MVMIMPVGGASRVGGWNAAAGGSWMSGGGGGAFGRPNLGCAGGQPLDMPPYRTF